MERRFCHRKQTITALLWRKPLFQGGRQASMNVFQELLKYSTYGITAKWVIFLSSNPSNSCAALLAVRCCCFTTEALQRACVNHTAHPHLNVIPEISITFIILLLVMLPHLAVWKCMMKVCWFTRIWVDMVKFNFNITIIKSVTLTYLE